MLSVIGYLIGMELRKHAFFGVDHTALSDLVHISGLELSSLLERISIYFLVDHKFVDPRLAQSLLR